jgi:hypothetical protein
VVKANKTIGYLNDTIWRNKHIQIRLRIYKTTIRAIMTYIIELRHIGNKVPVGDRDENIKTY